MLLKNRTEQALLGFNISFPFKNKQKPWDNYQRRDKEETEFLV